MVAITGLASRLAAFGRDQSGAVTAQVVIFSIILLGATGLVLDLGKVYSVHSQQQAYSDNVALAAAMELNGKDDSVIRARAAAFGVDGVASPLTKASALVNGDPDFEVYDLVFLQNVPTNAEGRLDMSRLNDAGVLATDPTNANYVLAITRPKTVSFSLLRLVGFSSGHEYDSKSVNTYAVATRQTSVCNDVSSIVMCNPFEGDSNTSFQAAMTNGQGRQFRALSDGTLSWDPSDGIIRIGLMKEPIGDPNEVCDGVTMPGYNTAVSNEQLEEFRDMCFLSLSQTRMACVGDKLRVKPSSPYVIATGVNTTFDIWDKPTDEIVWDTVAVGSNVRTDYMQPDQVTTKGLIPKDTLDPSLWSLFPPDDNNYLGLQNMLDFGYSHPLPRAACFQDDSCAMTSLSPPIAGETAVQGERINEYFDTNYPEYRELIGDTAFEDLFYGMATRADAYFAEHAVSAMWPYLLGSENTDPTEWETRPDPDLVIQQSDDELAPNYFEFADDKRRIMPVTIINCGSMEDDGDGGYRADVVDLARVLMTEPMREAPGGCVDTDGVTGCGPAEFTAANFYAEYISKASDITDDNEVLTYAVLVD